MAIRFLKGRRSAWQVYWNDPVTGKRRSMSFRTEAEAKREDSLIRHRLTYDRESFLHEEQHSQSSTLEECYLLYLKEKQFTKKGLRWQLDGMKVPLMLLGGKAVADITRDDIDSVFREVTRQKVSSATHHGRLSIFRTVIRWCAEKGYCPLPAFPKLPSAVYAHPEPPTTAELDAMLAVAEPHVQRVIIIGAQCGVRVGPSELFQLTWDDVDLLRGVLTVHGARKNPNAPWREVPIRAEMMAVFARWKAEDEKSGDSYLIHFNGKPVQSVKRSFASTLLRAGIKRDITPYALRRYFATELLAAGTDYGTVARLMGHSSEVMLMKHYQFVRSRQKLDAVEALPEVSICALGTYRNQRGKRNDLVKG